MGRNKSKQPTLAKEGIRPALMITATAPTSPTQTSAKNTAHPHPYPTVQPRKRGRVAVLEVLKPAPRGAIDVLDDSLQAMPTRALSLRANRCFELIQALRPRPFHTPFEVIAQKVKPAIILGIYDSCLDGMQRQPGSSALACMNSGSCRWQVSLLHVTDLPIPLSPTTCQSPDAALSRYPSARRIPQFPGFRLHHCLAGSPMLTGRIEFVILRMDRSRPAAPHPVLRRRSCIQLQAGERLPGEDFHLSDQCARRRTRGGRQAGIRMRLIIERRRRGTGNLRCI